MKLEFESNAVSPPFAGNQLPTEVDGQHGSPEAIQLLRDGIKAAQSGNKAEARNLLLRVTETDSENENAWLWLASISEYPEELLVFLNNVLQINPENERALEWAKATKSLIAKTFVQRGIDSAKSDQKTAAKQCFLQAIVHDSESELAWLWLASVTDSADEKVSHLQKVLQINPDNGNAQSSLRNAKQQIAQTKLPKANDAAISGDHETANLVLNEIIADAPDFEDAWMLKAHISESFDSKIAAFERVLEINPENPVARANIDSLKMFSGNVSDEKEVPKPMESLDLASHSDPVSETEMYRMEEFIPDAVSEHEPEEVPELEVEGEDAVEFEAVDEHVEVESDEVVEFEAVEDSVEESAEEEEAPVLFDDEEAVSIEDSETLVASSGEGAELDHDYEEEAVDMSEDADDDAEYEFSDVDDESDEVEMEASADEESAEFDSDEDEDEYLNTSDLSDQKLDAEEESEEADNYSSQEFESGDEIEAADETDDYEELSAEFEAAEAAEADTAELNDDDAAPPMPSFDASSDSEPEFPAEAVSKPECPYCFETNDAQAFACHGCKAIFTISDIDMILSHSKVDRERIQKALKRMESDKSLRGVDVNELKYLGIGYINLKDFRKGFDYLQEASRKDPNDVVLVSQIDALAVRLAEIEEHERGQEQKSVGRKILVVDDSPTVRKLISGKLEKCGHEAICAVDGMDALAKINEVIPDLILLDITMPRMDGYQVCKLIRSNDATKDVPVVMISGKDGFFDKVRGRMAGTSNYITKPFGPETLMKAVNEYIN